MPELLEVLAANIDHCSWVILVVQPTDCLLLAVDESTSQRKPWKRRLGRWWVRRHPSSAFRSASSSRRFSGTIIAASSPPPPVRRLYLDAHTLAQPRGDALGVLGQRPVRRHHRAPDNLPIQITGMAIALVDDLVELDRRKVGRLVRPQVVEAQHRAARQQVQ